MSNNLSVPGVYLATPEQCWQAAVTMADVAVRCDGVREDVMTVLLALDCFPAPGAAPHVTQPDSGGRP